MAQSPGNNVVAFAQLADYCEKENTSIADLKKYRSHRALGFNIATGTVVREVTTLRTMLSEANRNQWIKQNPFEFTRKNESD